MSTETVSTYVSREEYLERERAATSSKSEWIDGQIREMVGATLSHNHICANLIAFFIQQFRQRPLVPCPGDMKIRIPDGPYYYPDVAIVPDPPEFEDDRTDVVLNPLVLIEVLSPSTEAVDRGEKADNYRRLPSLTHYLLVDQARTRVDYYRREGDGWRYAIVDDVGETVPLASVGCELPLADVYERVFASEE